MVVVGLPGGPVELQGVYECTCPLRETVTLSKGDRFPQHATTEVWLRGGWPWKRMTSGAEAARCEDFVHTPASSDRSSSFAA